MEDSSLKRLQYFKKGLDLLKVKLFEKELAHIDYIVMPKLIGCDAGGCDWGSFFQAIENFAEKLPHEVYVYEFDPIEEALKRSRRHPLWGIDAVEEPRNSLTQEIEEDIEYEKMMEQRMLYRTQKCVNTKRKNSDGESKCVKKPKTQKKCIKKPVRNSVFESIKK